METSYSEGMNQLKSVLYRLLRPELAVFDQADSYNGRCIAVSL